MNGERLLVTGITGFIGRGTIAPLLADGWDVHAVSRTPSTQLGGVTMHALDLHDPVAVDALFDELRPTRVLHLAWDVTPGVYTTSLDNLRWVQSTLSLVQAFVRVGGQRLVGAGTCAEYDWQGGVCEEGRTGLQPATLYAAAKLGLFGIIDRLAAQVGFSFAWGRVFFMYGPGESSERLVPQMIHAAATGAPFALRYPRQRRDYLHVGDVSSAFARLVKSDVDGAVNIASADAIALADLATVVARHVGAPITLSSPASTPPDPFPVVVADTRKLTETVGWRPHYDLDDGVAHTVAWWKAQEPTYRA